ncbi:hypothetical protein SAMN05880590_101699 [Rhizobium sp. RU35A]|uniref:DUF937 domain-containing protein n=1 Tax=Rhizobium straminoryzae TaxID=1387186 RepID=A0A549TBF8_9HYPH|nr:MULTISPECIES: DUF937 domain-containing protein [Rhizobium]TRL39140.1 DUF937 domain-containing protein [Rhizobium straminoryzae]SIQ00052.1 hypothetical protein SAMN05880590_101699 [Rhizobium sp. RU35A]
MLPLFDMMMRAQNGAAMETMAKQFNLAQEQAAQAMAALMPAFSSGLKRTSSNPYDFSALMSSMFSGAYAQYFDDITKAFTPQGMADGNAILDRLFGSRDVTRAIAEQAAQLTGIGQEVLRQMMPAMADSIMGGLFKQMTGQVSQNPFSPEAMGKATQQWLEAIGVAQKPKPQPAPIPFDTPMFQAFRSMWGLEKPSHAAPAPNPFTDNPFAKAFQDMMAGAFQPAATEPPAPAAQAKPAQSDAPQPQPEIEKFKSMLNSMFDSGVEVQKAYQKNMEAIFDGYRRAGQDTPKAPV